MKKTCLIALCLLLSSAFVIVNVGTAIAYTEGYELIEYFGTEPVTVDGAWTTDAEWRATETNYMGTPQRGLFEYELDSSTGTYAPAFLVEFADSTNDPGDIIQVCMNGGVDSTSPTADDFKIELQGLTTLKVYVGTGSAWAETTTDAVTAAATITTSPHDPANHVVAEFWIDKGTLAAWGASPPPENVRVAMYDASNPALGWISWPPESSADNPSTWGQINGYSMEPAPEGLTIGLMLALSSVAAVVSIRYFRKPQKL